MLPVGFRLFYFEVSIESIGQTTSSAISSSHKIVNPISIGLCPKGLVFTEINPCGWFQGSRFYHSSGFTGCFENKAKDPRSDYIVLGDLFDVCDLVGKLLIECYF